MAEENRGSVETATAPKMEAAPTTEKTQAGTKSQTDAKPTQNRNNNRRNNSNRKPNNNQNRSGNSDKPVGNKPNNNKNKNRNRHRRQPTPVDENLKKFVVHNQEAHKQRLNPHFKLDLKDILKLDRLYVTLNY